MYEYRPAARRDFCHPQTQLTDQLEDKTSQNDLFIHCWWR